MTKDKKYVNNVYIREHIFPDGGSVLNIGIQSSEFVQQIAENTNSKGYCNIAIYKRATPSEKGVTHYATFDEYNNSK